MGGDGGYGGNGSIYWSVRHRGGGGAGQKLKNKTLGTTDPKNDHWIDIGNAAAVFNDTGLEIEGHDPTAIASPGTDSFRVDLRFSTASGQSAADLIAELLKVITGAVAAIGKLTAGQADASLTIEVPAIPRSSAPKGTPSDPYEVAVQWK